MANIITLGLSKIEFGDVDTGGGMGTTLAALGYTFEDTCKMSQDDPTVTDFRAEEVDDPIESITTKGKVNFTFSLMNPGLDALVALLGGAKTGTAPDEQWEAPSQATQIEQSVKITPQKGLVFEIARGKVQGKLNGEFSKSGLMMVDVTVTPLIPTDGTTAPIVAYPKA